MHHTGTRKPPQKKTKIETTTCELFAANVALSFFSFSLEVCCPRAAHILSLSPMNDDDDDDSLPSKKGEETIQKEEDFVFRVLLYLGF